MNVNALNIKETGFLTRSKPDHTDVNQVIERCLKGEQSAQKELFMSLAPKMKVVCLRYAGDQDTARDFLQEGFIRFFDKLASFKGNSSIETWATRLFINNCLTLLNKDKKRRTTHDSWDDNIDLEDDQEEEEEMEYSEEYLLEKISLLPQGYRTVLNLFVFEEKSHQEIADLLGISVNTSKTQYFKAKKTLKVLLREGSTG